MKWEHFFKDHILMRGYDYYKNGAVAELESDGDIIRATVSGTEDYEVEIYLKNNKIDDMYCSCPYADGGNNCKHMAAVLYAYEENDSREAAFDIEKSVNAANDAFIRRFLINALRNDKNLCAQFKHALSEPDDFDLNYYKIRANEIAEEHSDNYGYISYRDAYFFYEEISNEFSDAAEYLIENKRYDEALELSMFMTEFLCGLDIDDSDGCIGLLLGGCEELLLDIIKECGTRTEEKVFEEILKAARKTSYELARMCYDEFIMTNFSDKKFLDEKFAYIDEMINICEKSDSYHREYAVPKYLTARLELMQEMCGGDEIENFCRKYWAHTNIRRFLTDKYIEEEKYEDAINILNESLKTDKGSPGLIRKYLKKLKELYKITNDHDNYLSTLWRIVLESFALSDFIELKAQYNKSEWKQKRERVFEAVKSNYQKAEVFYTEGLYDRLLKCAVSDNGLGMIRKYKDALVPLFPEEILDKYTTEVQKAACFTSGRETYKRIVSVLREMRELPRGEERVQKIAAEWREKYRRRKAMMEELNAL